MKLPDHLREDDPAHRARHDAHTGNHRSFPENAREQVTRFGPDREADPELARARAHRERQDTRHPYECDRERHRGKSAEHQRIQPVGRQYFGANVRERRRLLDRLVGRQLANDPRNRGHERIRIGLGMHEHPSAADFLFERVIDAQCRPRHDILVVHVRGNADNTLRRLAHADELHDRIGPEQRSVHRVLRRKHAFRDALADDHDRFGGSTIPVVEVASSNDRDAESGEEAR